MKKSAGFSLLELMVALAIFSILSAVAVPSLRNFLINRALNTSAQEMQSSLLLARSEAVKRRALVYVRAHPGGWNQGWFVSPDAADVYADCGTAAGSCLSVTDLSGRDVEVSVPVPGGAASLAYNREGRARNAANTANIAGSANFCDSDFSDAIFAYQATIAASGSVTSGRSPVQCSALAP